MKKLIAASLLGAALFYAFLVVKPIVQAGVACSVPFVFINGQTADATQVNANFNSLVNCFSSAAQAGVNNDITALNALSTPITPAQGGTNRYVGGTSTGSANAQVVATLVPTGFTLVDGNYVSMVAGANNTGATTLNVASTGALPVLRSISGGYGTLVGGEILNTGRMEFVYSASHSSWVLINPFNSMSLVGMVADFASNFCPAGWQEANGTNNTISTTAYPDVNAYLDNIWGTNAGFTVMPDLRGTTVFGRDSGGSARITIAGGNFDGTTVGNTQYRQNWTLTAGQIPTISYTPTFTAGSFTPTITANYTPGSVALNSNVPIMTGGVFSGSTEFTISGSGSTAPSSSGSGRGWSNTAPNTSIPSYSPTLNAITSGNMNSFTLSSLSFGSGQSHPIIPNAAIVTKCVKL